MLGGGGGGESEELLKLTNTKLPPLGKREKNPDPVEVGEGLGNGKNGSHGIASVISPKSETWGRGRAQRFFGALGGGT